jgi:hypothetical protein
MGRRLCSPLILLLFTAGLHAQIPAATLPEFTFFSANHRTVSNSDLPKGKLILFVFIDPDCDHCQRAVTKMNGQPRSFDKVAIYFVSTADPEKVRNFAKKYASRIKGQWLWDKDSQFIPRFSPIRYPSLFLYSNEHKLLDYEDNEDTIFRIEHTIGKHFQAT